MTSKSTFKVNFQCVWKLVLFSISLVTNCNMLHSIVTNWCDLKLFQSYNGDICTHCTVSGAPNLLVSDVTYKYLVI